MLKVIVAGNGIRLSDSIDEFKRFVEWFNKPFAVTKGAIDLLPGHRLNIGNVGVRGRPEANEVVKSAGRIYVIGCSMAVQVMGYDNSIIQPEKVIEINEDIKETLRYFRVHQVPV